MEALNLLKLGRNMVIPNSRASCFLDPSKGGFKNTVYGNSFASHALQGTYASRWKN